MGPDLDEIVRGELKRLSYMETYILAKIIKSAPSPEHSGEVTLKCENGFEDGLLETLRTLESKGFIELSDFADHPLLEALKLCRDIEDLNRDFLRDLEIGFLQRRLNDLEYTVEFHKIFSLMKKNSIIRKIYPIQYLKPLTFMFREVQPIIALNFNTLLEKIPKDLRKDYISKCFLKLFDYQHYLEILKGYIEYCVRRALGLMKMGLFNDQLDEACRDYLNYISFLLPFIKPYTNLANYYSSMGFVVLDVHVVALNRVGCELIFARYPTVIDIQRPSIEVVREMEFASLNEVLNSAVIVLHLFNKLWYGKDYKLNGMLGKAIRGDEHANLKDS